MPINILSALLTTLLKYNGGERGIRTLGTVARTHAFQACSFNRSDISPLTASIKQRIVVFHMRVL